MNDASAFLDSLRRHDLAMLIRSCGTTIKEEDVDDGWFSVPKPVVHILAPPPVDHALRLLPQHDRKRIAEAIAAKSNFRAPDDIVIDTRFCDAIGGLEGLLAELVVQREIMISVATGGERIEDVNDYYRVRESRIRANLSPDLKYENPHDDLWNWFHHWKENFATYAERRKYIRDIFSPIVEAVSSKTTLPVPLPREPTGWDRVDRVIVKARANLQAAAAEEDWQAIGLLCREAIISLAQAVYDPEIHESIDGVTPSSTDANRMLEAYIGHAFPGGSNKEVRAHARASLALALNLQHRRTATRQLAALCLEATASTAAVISIIARPGDSH